MYVFDVDAAMWIFAADVAIVDFFCVGIFFVNIIDVDVAFVEVQRVRTKSTTSEHLQLFNGLIVLQGLFFNFIAFI